MKLRSNSRNFCGGAFQDWLEVNLIDKCNARCSWCIEKNGYHPKERVSWNSLVASALLTGAKKILLLGGEPTLHKDLGDIVNALAKEERKVWITTNGSQLNADYIDTNLHGVSGVNISIHHFDLTRNYEITGILLNINCIINSIQTLHTLGASVRLNCNCISSEIDTVGKIHEYIKFAKRVGADSVRFAELKEDLGFVDLATVMNQQFGLNDDPFVEGCNTNVIIDGMSVNFRQMCGIQTPFRVRPENPEQILKRVLYYDGKIYDGWQTIKKESVVTDKELIQLLEDVASGDKTAAHAALLIGRELGKVKIVEVPSSGSGCTY